MCLRLNIGDDTTYGGSDQCLMSVGAYALNEVTDFVIKLDEKDAAGDYKLWLGRGWLES